jgi:hypothetical protein
LLEHQTKVQTALESCENQLHSLLEHRPSSLVVKMLRLRTALQVVIDSRFWSSYLTQV